MGISGTSQDATVASRLTMEDISKLQEEVQVVQDHLQSLLGSSRKSEPIDGAMALPAVGDCRLCESKQECKLCFNEIREFCALVPCGHACLCYQCAKKIERRGCPFCREDISLVLKIF